MVIHVTHAKVLAFLASELESLPASVKMSDSGCWGVSDHVLFFSHVLGLLSCVEFG